MKPKIKIINMLQMDDDKKIEKKRKRFAARLNSSKGIICTENSGPNIVLCNVGQGTGLDKAALNNLINSLEVELSLPKLLLEKGETYSFLVFPTTEDAVLFFITCNGKKNIPGSNTPMYMSFIDSVPNNKTICQHSNPPGLILLNDFITDEEEKRLYNLFEHNEETGSLKNRQVSHYGYEFRYGSNDVDLSSPLQENIPEECEFLWKRLKEFGYDMTIPDQLTVNKYNPGHGIPTHVDKHSPFGDTILSVSLGSDVLMDWKHHSGVYVPVEVPARSMMIMSGESRYDWQHGIQPRTTDPILETRSVDNKPVKVITSDTKDRSTRISLTFRWTRSGPCQCSYKTLCDSVTSHIDDDVANSLEELHVHQVYEQIAGHFSTTRHKPWPKVVEFMKQVPTGAVVLDLGCGNGKNILKRNDILQIAGERSSGLLEECKEHIKQIPAADCVRLDLLYAGVRDGSADVIICIAVIHHFSSPTRRLQSISTIARLLRPNGQALITVWAKDQKKSNYLNKNKPLPNNQERVSINGVSLPVHENRTEFQHNDLLVPWKLRTKVEDKLASNPESTLLRYYHVFDEDELGELCRQVPGLSVENSFYEEGNWCVVCRKVS